MTIAERKPSTLILRTISYHVHGFDEIGFLQYLLRLRGYNVPTGGVWKKDDATDREVKAFQESCGLEPNGVVDGKTWDKLLERY